MIFDINLPGMDGFETLKRLRAIPEIINAMIEEPKG